ncbi:MAG: YaiO family outer membrane beta-barrel protein [Gammaproteobacteria bacterium]|nr:YaiO family outer membrane beta-barrel protein [Gammaproteobacteria bacterium]
MLMMVWSYSAQAGSRQELQVFHRYSSLNSGLSDWSDWTLSWRREQDADNRYYLELNDIYHFDVRDQKIALGYHHDSSATLQYQTELTTSTAHSLYPSYSLYGGIETKLGQPLILNSGLRFSHYDKTNPVTMLNSTADSLLFTGRLDYYSGNHLYSYSLYLTRMQGLTLADNALTHSIKYAYIYNDMNNIYLSYAQGDEIDFDPETDLGSSAIQSITLGGMHWMNQRLAIVYTVARHNVSSTNFGYQRNELYLGIRKLYG